jgi:hypothetical protein
MACLTHKSHSKEAVATSLINSLRTSSLFLELNTTSSAVVCNMSNANNIISLGNPFFVEKGKIIGQRVLTVEPQPKMDYTFSATGVMNGNVNVTDTGTIVSTLRNDGVSYSVGQGMIMTKDGEMATWSAQAVGSATQDGKMILRGAGFYNTNSTGKLAFLKNIVTVFKAEVDEVGNLSNKEWEWK